MTPSNPIGIFDSGIGGLNIAKCIHQTLPNESILYFGDTAHCPYGDKAPESITDYALKISDMLLARHCKLIVIACNSASAVAYDAVQAHIAGRARLVNVIDPAVDYISEHLRDQTLGIIATKATLRSSSYQSKLATRAPSITLKPLATPLLASAIEEGFIEHRITQSILETYLVHEDFRHIDSLLLGCTHYPLVKTRITQFFDERVDVIDPSEIVADTVQALLQSDGLLNEGATSPRHEFMVSDLTETFSERAQSFFGESITLNHYPMWL